MTESLSQEQVKELADRITLGKLTGHINQWLDHDASQRAEIEALKTRVLELEGQIQTGELVLADHRAAWKDKIERAESRLTHMTEELSAYRQTGLTEEILRRHDGFINLGKGCMIVRSED